MSFWTKISGTVADWFGLGGEESVAIGKDGSGNMVFKDGQVVGTKTLTQLLEGEAFDPDRLLFNSDGGIIYDSDGEIVLKENP